MQDELPEAVIRPATVDDADAIARVHLTSWREAYADVVDPATLDALDEAARTQTWRETIETRRGSVLVADLEGEIVGFAHVGASRDEDAERGTHEIYAIFLEPSAWGHGVARELMRSLLADLPEADPVTLWALADNERARHFYRRHGFSPDGVERMETAGESSYLEVRYRRG
ncbi:GNAT family N-acetyltransferase [Isoptericola sp. b441]|uniref:GNAT family N-acetyltransferase n=1 Tax=Actinotalea lenta TaxID=3064654 RepID=A0ABT9DB96_9CELL|nr:MULTISPECIES: GNAT family N-acetyltransferase [unclassified Isoptericola]MDO8108170.1 GNAT family N-acetyltransferase [Isoptericola sp. b441]MDO8120159.1 GNAT family N-acetyltransferase [Isoptericola sp. b490]